MGREWAHTPERPRISVDIKKCWDELLSAWSKSDVPLVIRKSGGVRGVALLHNSGRELIVADNSPAQWAFAQAYAGRTYDLDDVRQLLAKDEIPFAFATRTAEKVQMKYRRTLAPHDNVNKCGWKLCHIEEIGLSTRIPLVELPLDTLIWHFRLLVSPSNHFVVPLHWSGLGEVDEFIAEIKEYESRGRESLRG
jgi:hypothetical protein